MSSNACCAPMGLVTRLRGAAMPNNRLPAGHPSRQTVESNVCSPAAGATLAAAALAGAFGVAAAGYLAGRRGRSPSALESSCGLRPISLHPRCDRFIAVLGHVQTRTGAAAVPGTGGAGRLLHAPH
jgi:hypothetical protein